MFYEKLKKINVYDRVLLDAIIVQMYGLSFTEDKDLLILSRKVEQFLDLLGLELVEKKNGIFK